MASAAVTPPRSGFSPLFRIVPAVALATMVPNLASAQSIEDRARAAAGAVRARTGDSDTLRQNYVTPGLAGQPIATIDNSKSFNPNLSCQKSATLMEVLIQPSASGDIGSVQVARDTDLDGTVDSRAALPVPVSGICANGVISCAPGTWSQCRYFRWDIAPAGTLKLTESPMTGLAGCYCVNNSCGTNLVWGNLPSVLGDLGGGMIGALTTADPRIGVAQAVIDGPVIRYVGAQTTACAANQALPQSAYQAHPATLAGDAAAAATGNSVFQALSSSTTGLGRAQQMRRCTIERIVTAIRMGRIVGVQRSDIRLLKDVGKIAVCSLVAGLIALLTKIYLPNAHPLLLLIVSGIVFSVSYLSAFLMSAILTAGEWEMLQRQIARVRRMPGRQSTDLSKESA